MRAALLAIFIAGLLAEIFPAAANAQLPAWPHRATNTSGSEFIKRITPLDFTKREQEILNEAVTGNVPAFLRKFCPVTVTHIIEGKTNIGTFFIAPDYLAVGTDEDYLLTPMSPNTAQRIADQLGCVLPTRKMVDAIYASAEVKLAPVPIPPSVAMTTVPVFARHNEMVRTQRGAVLESHPPAHFEFAPSPRQSGKRAGVRGVEPDNTSASSPRPSPPFSMEEREKTSNQITIHPLGALTAGHQKDVVISARLTGAPNKVAIYGWHQTNGVAIQPLYLGHAASWVDYSQCVRLVQREMIVNGETKTVAEVLADPKLCGLISDEGIITNARYPTNPVAAAASAKIDLPWPEKFTASPHFGEMVREITEGDDWSSASKATNRLVAQTFLSAPRASDLPDGMRILINAPSPESFAPDKPVLLVFFALPNGSTIEQTIGKTLKPGDDWHFDIQHIGAQTRFLRAELTNRTLVVAYLEAATKSWPAWRKTHDDPSIARILDGVRGIFAGRKLEVVLTGHSGGGSLTFGYLNAVEKIPDDVKRIAFLDSNYAYETTNHLAKLVNWLQHPSKTNDAPLTPSLSPSDGERVAFRPGEGSGPYLCVLAYHDSVALLNGKTFVSEQGGTWGRSHAMLADLGAQFKFTSRTNNGLETFSALGGRLQFLLKENPEKKIFHTVQVERNGFIHALLSGTAEEGRGYEYFGERAYTKWIVGE